MARRVTHDLHRRLRSTFQHVNEVGRIITSGKPDSPQQLKEALEYQRANGGRLGTNLVKLGLIEDSEIAKTSQAASTASHLSIFPFRSRSHLQ